MGYIKCINWSLNAITMCWRQHLMSTSLVQLNWKVLNLSVSLFITTSEPQNTRLDLIFCYLLVPLLYKWLLHLNFELIVLLQIIIQIINLIILFIAFVGLFIHLFIPIQAPSTRIRRFLYPQIFLCGYTQRPYVSATYARCIRRFLYTLSRVESSVYAVYSDTCGRSYPYIFVYADVTVSEPVFFCARFD